MLTLSISKGATDEFTSTNKKHCRRAAAWHASPLVVVGTLMLVVAAASLVAMLVDPRVITGAPAWLKPFKFAISTAIYSLTVAWIFIWLMEWPRVRRVVGWTTAIVFVLEVAIIDTQAWRGTTSHFNISTPLNAVLFIVMGSAIFLQTAVSVATAVALWRHRFSDRTLGWALRLGMTLTIIGAMTGPLMTRPTSAQLADARAGAPMKIVGAHTVGGLDGGPGVPVTGWSTEHGDLRVPHFIGLHAVQAMALIAIVLRRWRRPENVRVKAMLAAAASYASLFVLLVWAALRGQSVSSLMPSLRSQSGPWSPSSPSAGLRLAPAAPYTKAWIGWPYDSRTAIYDPEFRDYGIVATPGVRATGAMDIHARSGDAGPARSGLYRPGGCEDARERRRILVPAGREHVV